MPTIVGVKLRYSPKTLFFDPADTDPAQGDHVVVETERGQEYGEVVEAPADVPKAKLNVVYKSVVRMAANSDVEHVKELETLEKDAIPIFRELIHKHELDMKPVYVEYMFEGGKIVFYFSAEERVDFRDLVRDLASRFKARIDMRQIGVRDEARMVGGIGHCGQVLCCERFPGDFQPVSIRMAKEQDLPLNPLKISGLCGRLMCCLRYEFDAYKEFKSRAPKRGAMIETPSGEAKVVELNTPRETAKLRMPDGKTLKVPVSCMECKGDSQRPCMVGQEALEAAGAPPAILVEAAPVAPASDKSEKSEKGERGDNKRRRRSRRSSSGKPKGEKGQKQAQGDKARQGGQKPKDGQKPKGGQKPRGGQKPKGEGGKKTDGQPKPKGSSSSHRRRRRRRPSGGSGSNQDSQGSQNKT